jgi:L-lysine exporter family protein LysE/ArgO
MGAMPFLSTAAGPVAPAFLQGLALSLGLIVAIGAQNAFVLRQGLRREHVGPGGAVLRAGRRRADASPACSAWPSALGRPSANGARTGARRRGFSGLVRVASAAPRLSKRRQPSGRTGGGEALSRRAALAQAAAFTLLNPHVYLDTVLLVGSIGAQQPAPLRGLVHRRRSSSASVVWFSAARLSGARWLAPWFARPHRLAACWMD